MSNINLVLLILMSLAALWTVMARSLLKAAVGLAFTSAMITILMFRLDSSLAAVFELSVCSGLITVVFVSAISLTKPLTNKEILELSKNKFRRYKYLPVICILVVLLALKLLKVPIDFHIPQPIAETDPRNVMWNLRQLDLFGQILVLLAGAFGIVLLFKRK